MPDSPAPAPRRRFNWWFAFIGLLMLVLALLTLSKGHTLVETSIEIEGTPQQVWAVLTDFDAYPDWNPFITQISGTPEAGQTLSVTIQPPGGKAQNFKPTVLSSDPGRELRWLGRMGLPRIFDGRHYFVIDTEGLPEGRVKFVHGESFEGMLVPFMAKRLDTKVRQGFEQMNAALAERVKAAYPALLPGTAAGFLYAPPGAIIHRLQPTQIEQGAGGKAGYTSYIAYFTPPDGGSADMAAFGDQLIEAGFDLARSDSSRPEEPTDYYLSSDGTVEVALGRFHTEKELADAMATIGRPVFPEGFPEQFLQGDAYQGYRIEVREYNTDQPLEAPDNTEAAEDQPLIELPDTAAPGSSLPGS